jgi:hypothetical protein
MDKGSIAWIVAMYQVSWVCRLIGLVGMQGIGMDIATDAMMERN